jgi:acetoin utilization deacetylase AcuC-like enzyme
MLPLVYHQDYSDLVLPERHRYPIGKYRALYHYLLQAGWPAEWIECQSAPATLAQLALVHQPAYVEALCTGSIDHKAMRRIGFPWSEFLIQRSLQSVGGTIRTMQLALQHGVALHLSGGYHHAFAAEGAGFCLFNDLAVAAAMALQQGVDKVLIFDCDVHQGDGCALIFADEPRVITASLHGEKNFPARKQQSDWDIGLPTHCDDSQYLEALHQSLSYLLALHQPDLVLYDAGVDIHQDDDLGLLQISTAGIYQRDLQLFRACKDAQIPVAAVIGGGYQRNIQKLTVIHSQLFRAASSVWLPMQPLQWPDEACYTASPEK